jgi:hypothetical protein
VTAETQQQSAIRQLSKVVFGNRHKLEILAGIGKQSDGIFYVQQLADELSIPSTTVRPVVKGLTNLVDELPAGGSATSPHYHRRLEHPIWQMTVDLLHDLRAADESTNPQKRNRTRRV